VALCLSPCLVMTTVHNRKSGTGLIGYRYGVSEPFSSNVSTTLSVRRCGMDASLLDTPSVPKKKKK
jgi:hypothetical protein